MQKVLVTGATGFIGIEVSRQLAELGVRPRLMVRRPVRGLMLRNLDAEIMQADIRSLASLHRILQGIDTVIHLGARAAFEPYPRLHPSIVKGSLNLMQAAIEEGVDTFVYGGSLLAYRDTTQPIDQETDPAPMSGYGRAKLEAELSLEKLATKAGVRFTSLRLPHVYGAHSLLFDQVRHGKVYFPGKGDNPFAHLHVFDAARALIQAAENGRPGLRVTHVPQAVSYLGTRVLDILFGLTAQPNPYPSGAVSCWNLRLPVIAGTIYQTVGLEPRFPTIHEGVPAVLDDSISFYWLPSNLDRL